MATTFSKFDERVMALAADGIEPTLPMVCARALAVRRLAGRCRCAPPAERVEAELRAMRAAGEIDPDDRGCGCRACPACTPPQSGPCPLPPRAA